LLLADGQRWAATGEASMADRSSRPHRVANRTPQQLVRKVVHLRWKQRLGRVAIGARLSVPASTVHAVLVRCRLNRLHHVDKRTGEVSRRYGHGKALGDDPRRCKEAQQYPSRGRLALRRPTTRQTEPCCDSAKAA